MSWKAVPAQPSPFRPTAQVLSCSPPSCSATFRRSSMLDRRSCGCNSWRRVTRCAESMEGRAALAGDVGTAHGVPPSAAGCKHRSSVVYSRGRSSEPRLAVGAHRARRSCGCNSWRRVTRCAESMEGRAALAGDVGTAQGVPPSVFGSYSFDALIEP